MCTSNHRVLAIAMEAQILRRGFSAKVPKEFGIQRSLLDRVDARGVVRSNAAKTVLQLDIAGVLRAAAIDDDRCSIQGELEAQHVVMAMTAAALQTDVANVHDEIVVY